MNPLRGLFDGEPAVALLVDGPNVFRDAFDVDLEDLRDAGRELGRLAVARVYLDQNATGGLIQAAEANGFETVVTSGDVDVRLALDAAELVLTDRIDVLAISSRDMDFKPAIELAGRHGVTTVAIAPGEYGRSGGLGHAADAAITLGDGD